ncbi:fas-binding factor 1 isoform X2 [Protopterus annectens]|uniref:fas-binding factor 1 isoform X2 n=1 Tax=Protopterus annectens TaxID=7888 RepID=UPI001CF942B3|nr:fas-binding factor 1 isoform X2 [Protopterus annectens]
MASKSKKDLRSSIDSVLDDLLGDGDDPPAKQSKSPVRGSVTLGGKPGGLVSRPSKRSLLDDDFFSKIAEEADKDEESDISEADPRALLESMKDIDDMDADLFGTKKKPSSAPGNLTTKAPGVILRKEDPSKTEEKPPAIIKEPSELVDETKPRSAPAGSGRQYKTFSFDELEDPLADILSDEEGKQNLPSLKKRNSLPNSDMKMQKKEVKEETGNGLPSPFPAQPVPTSQKKDDLNFDDDEDDLMGALGFAESPKIHRKEEKNSENEVPRPARSKLDELLGRGTAAKLLERPPTGELKEFKLDKKYQKPQDKSDFVAEDDFAYGAYQPTMTSTPEGRQSRRQSVRFSMEDVSDLVPDQKSKPSTPTTPRSARANKSGADWLGLKGDDLTESTIHLPSKESTKMSGTLPNDVPSSPSLAKKPPLPSRPSSGVNLEGEATVKSKPNQSGSTTETPVTREEDDWLVGALARKKTQVAGKANEKKTSSEDFLDLGDEVDLDAFKRTTSSPAMHQQPLESSTVNDIPDDKPSDSRVSRLQSAAENIPEKADPFPVPSSRTNDSVKDSSKKVSTSNQQDPQMSITEPQVPFSAQQLQHLLLQQQIRKLELERSQQKILLENLQQRQKEDIELFETAHRSRLKIIEESCQQRESHLQKENQELAAQLKSVLQNAEKERSEVLAQCQRKVTEYEQEKVKEIERLRELQRLSVSEMRKDHEEQLQRVKMLKDQEIDAVTSATSHTRSLNIVVEQMEAFSKKLGDLSYKVESTHHNTAHELEMGARQRDEQLRVLQDRLTQQQRDMEVERNRLHDVIAKMETRLSEQTRLLEKERWRVTAEQSKVESMQRSLEEERRVMNQQLTIERDELERAKTALLEEQQSVMQQCAEQRKKIASEWAEFRAQQKLTHEHVERSTSRALQMDAQREESIITMAKEQAELKIKANALKMKEEQLARDRETLEQDKLELQLERERVNALALRIKQRAEEIERMSKLASEKYEEGERALLEAKRVESEHQARLHTIHQQMERLQQQEQQLHKERLNLAGQRQNLSILRDKLPFQVLSSHSDMKIPPSLNPQNFKPSYASTLKHSTGNSGILKVVQGPASSELLAKLALIKHTAEKDRDFLEDEQFFLETLKKAPYNIQTT